MKTTELVKKLDELFKFDEFKDSMIDIVKNVDWQAADRFNQEYLDNKTGLMCKNSSSADSILCALFPSEDVFSSICSQNISDALLFVKHSLEWEETGSGFVPFSKENLELLRKRNISLYSAHAPVDNNLSFAPSYCFAKQLNSRITEELAQNGRNFGWVVEPLPSTTYSDLKNDILKVAGLKRLQEHFHHKDISRIAVSSGGGDNSSILEQSIRKGCDTYVTGILFFRGSDYAMKNNPEFIEHLKKAGLNGFGATHYLTEVEGIKKLAASLEKTIGVPVTFVYEKKKVDWLKENWGLII